MIKICFVFFNTENMLNRYVCYYLDMKPPVIFGHCPVLYKANTKSYTSHVSQAMYLNSAFHISRYICI